MSRSKKVEKSIDLSKLPKLSNGRTDWAKAIGFRIPFLYDTIRGEFEIVDYNTENKLTLLQYRDSKQWLQNQTITKCYFRNFLYQYLEPRYLFEIGQEIKDDKKHYVVLNREIRERQRYNKQYDKYYIEKDKWYYIQCLNCNQKQWLEESQILLRGCGICANQIVAVGYNDLATTRPDLVKYFENPEDAKTVTEFSEKKKDMNCPICHNCHKIMRIAQLNYFGFSCDNCRDNISYGEKFIRCLLNQLNVNYIFQLSKTTFKWVEDYYYDFYLTEYNYIIEVMGSQHSTKAFDIDDSCKTIEEQQEIDQAKKDLALKNGIDKYLCIDFIHYDLNTIIHNILESDLIKVLNITPFDINWDLCVYEAENPTIYQDVCNTWDNSDDYVTFNIIAKELNIGKSKIRRIITNAQENNLLKKEYMKNKKPKYRDKNLIKEICDYWVNHQNERLEDIGLVFNLHRKTIGAYLQEGKNLGYCNYDSKEIRKTNAKIVRAKKSHSIDVLNDDYELLYRFDSATIAAEELSNIYNDVFKADCIRRVCSGERQHYKNLRYRYVD